MLRVIAISDTHTHHNTIQNIENLIDKDATNILVHTGDSTKLGEKDDILDFLDWFNNLKNFDYKFLISGNHDWCFFNKEEWLISTLNKLKDNNCIYLEDEEYILNIENTNIKIYGSPWQPLTSKKWAFGCDEYTIGKYWDMIPNDTDILLTHTPPYYIHDLTTHNLSVGCIKLREKIMDLNLSLNVHGHIHESRNASMIKDTVFVNASICNSIYNPVNKPIIIDFNIINNKLNFKNITK
jgi:Icc-related predicted phosphoesterase